MNQPRFRSIRKFLAPRWLTEGEGELVGYALDIVKDAFVERVRLGLLARLPFADGTGTETAPTDALVAIGRDRRITRGLEETDVNYATRLLSWLDAHRTAGGAFSMIARVMEYLGASKAPWGRTVDNSGNWYTTTAAGIQSHSLGTGNWDWDGGSAWGRFWVIVYPGTRWTTRVWGETAATWTDARTWGSTATPNEIVGLKRLVNDWKPAGTICAWIIVAFDVASFDPTSPEPDGTWGPWSKNVGGTQVPTRLATARYIDGADV